MPKYYVRHLRWGAELGEEFWCLDADIAYRIDQSSEISRFARSPEETDETTLQKIASNGEWHPLDNSPGHYYPRMARPSGINEESPGRNPEQTDQSRHYRARSAGQLHAFLEQIDQICRVIQPEGSNLQAYGHATRNLLILACTEAEAHWKTVLEANGYKSKDKKRSA